MEVFDLEPARTSINKSRLIGRKVTHVTSSAGADGLVRVEGIVSRRRSGRGGRSRSGRHG
jgi:hypothetical protein